MNMDLETIHGLLVKMGQRLDKIEERLDKIEERLDKMDERFDKMDERFDKMERRFDGLEKVLEDNLNRMDARFDDQAARLDRHAALWQTGRRWSNRMDQWAEKIDAALEVKDKQIADLTGRLEDLEHNRPPATSS